MFRWVVFCPVVSIVQSSWPPVDFELFLTFCVAKPMKPHVHGFCPLWLDFAIDYTIYHWIICLQWRWWLFVPQLFYYYVNVDYFSCYDVECYQLGFCCWRHDVVDDVCYVQNYSIIVRHRKVSWQIEMATCPTLCLGFAQIACVAVCSRLHITCIVRQHSLFLCSCVIEKSQSLLHCFFSWCWILWRNHIHGAQERAVDCTSKEQNNPHTCWMKRLLFSFNGGAVEACVVRVLIFAPHLIGAKEYGVCCFPLALCLNCLNAFAT